ncbi:hypothetical protein [Ruegeria lacuscaerulensis]|uniref:hypothetical protein n=1 Tax=Ruegeria lacuscaerulensis TaxID=55218 RepID=UPI00147E1A2B|nr:hypothetical protein [Ruegeria lacuscaerulensis]
MELTYPINFVGFEHGATSGDVITRDGEILGSWTFIKDEEDTGEFQFFADGETEPMFTEGVAFLSSGLRVGMALSTICRTIRDWHDESEPVEKVYGGLVNSA